VTGVSFGFGLTNIGWLYTEVTNRKMEFLPSADASVTEEFRYVWVVQTSSPRLRWSFYDNRRYDNIDGTFVGFNGFANLTSLEINSQWNSFRYLDR